MKVFTSAGLEKLANMGDVTGPGGVSTDEAVVRWDGTSGQLVQNSVVLIDDTGNITGVNDLTLTGQLTGTFSDPGLIIDGGTI